MKKKIYTLMLVVAMLAMALVGCGSDTNGNTDVESATNTTDTTNTTNDVTVNTEVEESGEDVVVEPTKEPIVEPTTEPEVEEPVVEPTTEPEVETTVENEEDDFYSDSYQWTFPSDMDGFTDKFVYASDETMSFNCTHYVDPNGNEMNFSWVGPTELGENAGFGSNGTTLILKNSSGEYALRAFTTGELSPETYDEIKSYDKETIISFAAKDSPYITDGYYDSNIGDTYMSFTFAVASDTQKGYNHYIMDREKGLCYQFVYLENNDIYDDTRTMNVINSLDFWTYNPGE